jgi:hypothetical protein
MVRIHQDPTFLHARCFEGLSLYDERVFFCVFFMLAQEVSLVPFSIN